MVKALNRMTLLGMPHSVRIESPLASKEPSMPVALIYSTKPCVNLTAFLRLILTDLKECEWLFNTPSTKYQLTLLKQIVKGKI